MESILNSIKEKLGMLDDYTQFDNEIIMDINSAFFILNTLGVGPDDPFTISSADEVWTDFMVSGKEELVKSYITLRVKLLFDPPSNSFLVDSINKQISEFEFRLMVDAEKDKLPEADMTGIYLEEPMKTSIETQDVTIDNLSVGTTTHTFTHTKEGFTCWYMSCSDSRSSNNWYIHPKAVGENTVDLDVVNTDANTTSIDVTIQWLCVPN